MANCNVIYQFHHQLIPTKLSDEAITLLRKFQREREYVISSYSWHNICFLVWKTRGKLELLYNYPTRVPSTVDAE